MPLTLSVLLLASAALAGETRFVPESMSSGYNNNYAYYMNDGQLVNNNKSWVGNSADMNGWFCATFVEPVVITRIDIYQWFNNLPTTTSLMRNFQVEGSNDWNNWTVITSITGFPKPTENMVASPVVFENETAYTHYRIYAPMGSDYRGTGSKAYYAVEVEYYGVVDGEEGPGPDPDPDDGGGDAPGDYGEVCKLLREGNDLEKTLSADVAEIKTDMKAMASNIDEMRKLSALAAMFLGWIGGGMTLALMIDWVKGRGLL